MVVHIDLTPYPDVEDMLMAYLSELGYAVDTVVPPDGQNGIEIVRLGGTDDGITDYPRVEISCYSSDRDTARNMAETVRQAMRHEVITASEVVYTDGDGINWRVQVDRSDTDTPPENVGYKNPDRRRKPAFYRLALRRPRTAPMRG
jgi:hypothetical protein